MKHLKKRIKHLEILKSDTYLLNIIRKLKFDYTIKNISDIKLIEEDYQNILKIINEDIIREKINTINDFVNNEYNNSLFKLFISKEKYIYNANQHYYKIINNIEKNLKEEFSINNPFSLLYLKKLVSYYLICSYKNNYYEQKKIINIYLKLILLYKKYNSIYKRLYIITNNDSKLQELLSYERLDNKDIFNKEEELNNIVKKLEYNKKQ